MQDSHLTGGKMATAHTHDVCSELDEEDGDAAQRQRHADRDVDEVRGQLRNVLRQRVGDGLLQVVKDQTTYQAERVKKKSFIFNIQEIPNIHSVYTK